MENRKTPIVTIDLEEYKALLRTRDIYDRMMSLRVGGKAFAIYMKSSPNGFAWEFDRTYVVYNENEYISEMQSALKVAEKEMKGMYDLKSHNESLMSIAKDQSDLLTFIKNKWWYRLFTKFISIEEEFHYLKSRRTKY